MRVAINVWFWHSPTTGSGQYTRWLVEHLAGLEPDLDMRLVAPQKWGAGVSHFALEPLPSDQLDTPALRSERRNLTKVWFEQVAFSRTCRRLGADVAHVPYWAPPIAPAVPTVVTVHDLIPLLLRDYRGGSLARLYTALVSSTARNATLVLTDSMASRQDIVAHLGVPPDRVRVVYLAAGERFSPTPAPDDAQILARYSLPERYVLYLGGFDVRKNLDTVISTYCWAGPVIGEECPLVIAGRLPAQDTPFAPDPRRMVREQGIDERFVRFTGFVEEADKPALYRGAAAFLFPSHYEGFGLPPLEALACGTPVVGSDASSIPEVVGDAGVLLPPNDAEGMAGALIQLATDEDLRNELGRRALVQAARFSWERTARETLEAYRDAANQ